MKKKIKNIIMMLSFVLLVTAMAGEKPIKTEAKTQDGTYYFSSCMVTRFQIRNNKLTLKVSKSDNSGITKKNNKNYKKYELIVKVSKKCKYRWEEFERGTGESNRGSTGYSDIKKSIAEDRSFYKETGNFGNAGLSRIVVKNGQIVKIVYCYA